VDCLEVWYEVDPGNMGFFGLCRSTEVIFCIAHRLAQHSDVHTVVFDIRSNRPRICTMCRWCSI